MKKALCSIGSGEYSRLLALSSQTFNTYAARHDYDLILKYDSEIHRPAAWSKVPLILQLLEAYDLVLWVDADAIIIDPEIDIASEARRNRWLYLARMNTSEGSVPNTGVWMIRSCLESKNFLRIVDRHHAYTNHKWWENAAVIDLLGYTFDPVRPNGENEFSSGVHYLDRAWNSIPLDPSSHPRIKHYPALPLEARARHLHDDLASVNERTELPPRLRTGATIHLSET